MHLHCPPIVAPHGTGLGPPHIADQGWPPSLPLLLGDDDLSRQTSRVERFAAARRGAARRGCSPVAALASLGGRIEQRLPLLERLSRGEGGGVRVGKRRVVNRRGASGQALFLGVPLSFWPSSGAHTWYSRMHA